MGRPAATHTGIAVLILLLMLGCSPTPKSDFELTVKNRLDQADGGKVFTPLDKASLLTSLKDSVKTEKDASDLWSALMKKDETAVLTAMAARKVAVLALPVDAKMTRGSVFENLVKAGFYEKLSVIYRDPAMLLATAVHPAYQVDDAGLKQVVAYVRQTLAGQTGATLPAAFNQPFPAPGLLDLRFTDKNGYNKTIGLVRARGNSPKKALDVAIGEAKTRYAKRGGGGLTAEPFDVFLQNATITLNFHREGGALLVDPNKLSAVTSLGLDGFQLDFPKEISDKAVMLTPDKSKIYRMDNLKKLLEAGCKAKRLDKDAWKKKDVKISVFRTLDITERNPGGDVIRLRRGVEYVDPAKLDRAETEKGFREGADWLLSILDPQSKMFKYVYYAARDSYKTNQYNIIRHGLATLTLIQAYELFGEERYLDGAKLAIEWVLDLTQYDGKLAYFNHPRFDRQFKLGGAGVMLQCMTEYFRFKKVPEWEKPMKGLAELIMHLQEENGHYISYYTKPGQKKNDREVTIYPGEANLALVRMYHIFKDQRYLDTLRKAFEYYSKWFRDNKSDRRKGNLGAFVPWDMSAMMEYYEIVKKDEVAQYAYDMADWILDNWFVYGLADTYWMDYQGGYRGAKSRSNTPIWNSGVYGEGVASIFRLAKLRGDKDKIEKYRKATFLTVRFVRQSQYRQGSTYYLPQPSKAIGCIPSNFHTDDCRLDFAYHCLTVNYRVLRFFDEADWKAIRAIR